MCYYRLSLLIKNLWSKYITKSYFEMKGVNHDLRYVIEHAMDQERWTNGWPNGTRLCLLERWSGIYKHFEARVSVWFYG